MRAGAGERVSKPLSSTSQRQRGCGQWQNGTEKGRFGGEHSAHGDGDGCSGSLVNRA